MRDLHIRLSMVDFISVLDVHVWKKVNEHGYAKIKGIIADKDETVLFRNAESDEYAVLAIEDDDGNTKNIFAGIVKHIQVENVGGVKTAEIQLQGATKLMDSKKHTRTFQNKGMSYEQMLDIVNADYRKIMYLTGCGNGTAINNLIVQYNETDWEFIKRLASHFYQPIVPDYGDVGIRYSFGLSTDESPKQLNEASYKVESNVTEYRLKDASRIPGIYPADFQYYEVRSREYTELGEKVIFQGKEFYVYESESTYTGDELVHKYILRRKGGFSVVKNYNTRITGASLSGTVLAVKNDTVKIKLDVDGKQDEETAQWFAYSTVYSSEDGTGWYCMPEKNDKIRLYFPDEKEEDGYVISSINTDNGTTAGISDRPRSNPDRKSISNKYQKQIELTPTSIMLTNNKGMRICLDDEKGINITSDKKVTIESMNELSIKSDERLDVEALSSIQLLQGSTKLRLEDEITVEGASFKVQ